MIRPFTGRAMHLIVPSCHSMACQDFCCLCCRPGLLQFPDKYRHFGKSRQVQPRLHVASNSKLLQHCCLMQAPPTSHLSITEQQFNWPGQHGRVCRSSHSQDDRQPATPSDHPGIASRLPASCDPVGIQRQVGLPFGKCRCMPAPSPALFRSADEPLPYTLDACESCMHACECPAPCRLNGSLPAFLGNQLILSAINLAGNEFTGSLPPDLFDHLGSLATLNLLNSRITGTIPSNIGWEAL